LQHPGLQILHQELKQLNKLRIGRLIHVAGGQHVQELLAFGLVGILPGNKRRAKSKAFMPGWTR
jgi:hypothetical protein